MSDERLDPEMLAAFLDGTASPEERENVLRTIARSKEAYADFIETAAIQRELDAQSPVIVADPAPPTVSSHPTARETAESRWFRRWYLAPALLAAGIAAVLFVRGGLPSSASVSPGAIQLVQATRLTLGTGSGALARTLGETWHQPPWSVTRGIETSLGPHSLAFRAAARYAQLELAAQAGDSAAVIRSADLVAQLLGATEGGAAIAASFREIAQAPDFGGQTRRAAVARQLRALLGADDWFDLGAWAETARLAVAARDAGFFEPRGRGVSELRRIMQPHTDASKPDSAEWAPVVDALRPLFVDRSWSPNELDVVGRAVGAAIAAAAR